MSDYINRKDFYLYKCSPEKEQETKTRLTELSDLGMKETGIASFGIPGIMSGLYIEMVWNYSDTDWKSYIDWVKEMKAK